MPTADYRNNFAHRVPGASSIAGIGKNTAGITHWAWDLGMKGLDYRKMRDEAAMAGNIGHLLVEHAIREAKGKAAGSVIEFPTDGAATLGRRALDAYHAWSKISRIRWVDAELSLVSEKYQYGGTIDAIGIEEGSNTYCIGDWKTGKLYPEHLCQIAAYGKLFEECTEHSVSAFHLCRFNKETGDFTHARYANLEKHWECFLTKRKLYDQMKDCEKDL